jgi:hypothetical protein
MVQAWREGGGAYRRREQRERERGGEEMDQLTTAPTRLTSPCEIPATTASIHDAHRLENAPSLRLFHSEKGMMELG